MTEKDIFEGEAEKAYLAMTGYTELDGYREENLRILSAYGRRMAAETLKEAWNDYLDAKTPFSFGEWAVVRARHIEEGPVPAIPDPLQLRIIKEGGKL